MANYKNFLKLGVIGLTLSLAVLTPNANAISITNAASASRAASSQSHNHHGSAQPDTPQMLQAKAELSDKLEVVLQALGGITAATAIGGVVLSRKFSKEAAEEKTLAKIEDKPNFLNKIGKIREDYNPSNTISNKNGYTS